MEYLRNAPIFMLAPIKHIHRNIDKQKIKI